MKRVLLDKNNVLLVANKVVNYLIKGKIVVMPTDTVYGISCIYNSKKSIDKIYKIKKRAKSKQFLTLVGDFSVLDNYFDINKKQREYFEKQKLKKPTTFLMLLKNGEKIGLRMPFVNKKSLKTVFICEVLRVLNQPIISTSLNLSGEKQINKPSYSDILSNFDKNIDLFIDMGNINSNPSCIKDVTDLNNIKKIR